MERDDGSKEPPAFISVIEWQRIPAEYLKNKKQKRKNYKYAKTKTVHTMRGASLLCSCAGLVLQRKYGCIMLLIARQGERAYANEIF